MIERYGLIGLYDNDYYTDDIVISDNAKNKVWCRNEDVLSIEAEKKKLKEIIIESIGDYKWFNEKINNLLKRIDKDIM